MKKRYYVYSIATLLTLVRFVALSILYPALSITTKLIVAAIGWVFVVFLFEVIDAVNRLLNRRLPFERGAFRRLALQIALCASITLSVHTLVLLTFIDRFPYPVERLTLLATYFIDVVLVVAVNTGYFGVYFFERWKQKLVEAERLDKEKAMAQKERAMVQFDNLKNQLNPHFLFNSLASLNSLIYENQDLASEFLQQLAKVYRYVLENREREWVPLRTEVQFVGHYLQLLQTRFGPGLETCIEVEPGKEERRVVPVTLQILIENALKHNVVNSSAPLRIRIYTEGDYLRVENNRQKKAIVESSNRIGLENMKTLYTYLSPAPVEVQEDEKTFSVGVPLF